MPAGALSRTVPVMASVSEKGNGVPLRTRLFWQHVCRSRPVSVSHMWKYRAFGAVISILPVHVGLSDRVAVAVNLSEKAASKGEKKK